MRTISDKDLATMVTAIDQIQPDIKGNLLVYNRIRRAKLVVNKLKRSEKIYRK